MDAEPAAGTRVQRGARVTLVLAGDPATPAPTTSPSPSRPTPTPTGEPTP